MTSISHKRILLGVTGGIAAYKSAELIRRLKDHHADVRVVMTKAAQEFITPMTLQALSGNEVHTDLLDPKAEAAMGHIELARWADLIVIAPASADFLARLNSGMADDLLTTLCLATRAKVLFAPAMNQAMWEDPQTQNNFSSLEKKDYINLGSDNGSQACGEIGPGRMLDPTDICKLICNQFETGVLSGKHIVITAGPTREALDPVRYISNHSSGKMGYALATAAINAGARVSLITGPTNLDKPERADIFDVLSAMQMHDKAIELSKEADIFIACAAVADYRPLDIAKQKIKKSDDTIELTLVKNPDIVAAVGQLDPKPVTVGFAAETENLINNAQSKLERKNLDLIVANDVSDTRIGFNSDSNAATLITADKQWDISICSKTVLAESIIETLSEFV